MLVAHVLRRRGRYADQAGNGKALVDTLSGSSWSGVAAPLPTGAGPTNSSLLGISCASPTSSAASGGYHDNTSGSDLGLLEVLANGTWTPAAATPLPSNAATGSSQHSTLLQTSCPSTNFCVANGVYDDLERGEAAPRDLERDELERDGRAVAE